MSRHRASWIVHRGGFLHASWIVHRGGFLLLVLRPNILYLDSRNYQPKKLLLHRALHSCVAFPASTNLAISRVIYLTPS